MKLAFLLLFTLLCIGWSTAELAESEPSDQEQADEAYYPSLHTVVQDDRRGRPRGARRRLVTEPHQKRRRVYDYGMYEADEGEDKQPNRLQLKDGRHVQYGNQRRWAVWPRSRDGTRYSSTSHWREQTTTPTPTKLPPRLMLRSGDNVHFGEGINWSIYKTDSGLTRVGTRDGEVVVRVVRPHSGSRPAPTTTTTTTPKPRPTTERVRATTSYQWQWQPCHNEQECYRQYVNEYYRFYDNNN